MKKILILALAVSIALNFYFIFRAIDARERAKTLAIDKKIYVEAFDNLYIYHKKEIPKAKTFAAFALSEAYSRVMAEEKRLSPEEQFRLVNTEGLEFAKNSSQNSSNEQ